MSFFSGFHVIGIFPGDENTAEPIKPQCYTGCHTRSPVFKITLMYYSLRVDVYANYRSMCPPGHHGLIATTTKNNNNDNKKCIGSLFPSKLASIKPSPESM